MGRDVKIKDLKEGAKVVITLAVVEVDAKKTARGNDYLRMTFFDGTEKIDGNYWDWSGKSKPAPNSILDVTAEVGSWQGNKQLNIKALNTCKDFTIEDFLTPDNADISTTWASALSFISQIKCKPLRDLVESFYMQHERNIKAAPGAKAMHHNYVGGLLKHTVGVTSKANALSKCMPEANTDLVIAGALLHDVGKLWTYSQNCLSVDFTNEGQLQDHIVLGLAKIAPYLEGLPTSLALLLTHIITAHHGKLEWGSPVQPLSLEAYIVHTADNLDATEEYIVSVDNKTDCSMFSDKLFALNNRPHVLPSYTNNLVETFTEDSNFTFAAPEATFEEYTNDLDVLGDDLPF